ncbi:MAG: hypothetical protein AB6733_13445 [Clostridiaceae bacterium]
MKLNKKLVAFGLILLILIWIGNIFYYEKHVLKEPLFLQNYSDVYTDLGSLQLSYIQNINYQDRIIDIYFPELEIHPLILNDIDMGTNNNNYKLKTILLNMFNDPLNKTSNDYKDKVITKAEVKFSSGKVLLADLGKIYIQGDSSSVDTRADNIKLHSTSVSSDNTGYESFGVMKDLNITWIYSRFYEEIKDVLKITINEKELSDITFPIKLKQDEPININYSFKFDKNDIRKNYLYNIRFYIFTEDSQGNKGYEFFNINSQPPTESLDINLLKNSMEEN